jgi:hypothetical protein
MAARNHIWSFFFYTLTGSTEAGSNPFADYRTQKYQPQTLCSGLAFSTSSPVD